MKTSGELRIDPGALQLDGPAAELEVVVPYTELAITASVLSRVQALTAGLNARVALVAVHALPYPMPFACPTAAHAYLVEQLVDLAGRCDFEVTPQVVLARDRQEGFRYALKPGLTVVVGTRKRPWRTSEEKLARSLARDGHNVALLHVA